MDKQLQELADNLGRREATLTLGELELTLRPMTLNDMVAFQQDLAKLGVNERSAAGLRSQLYYCAKRGGYEGTEESIGDHITELDIARARAALSQVFPTELQSVWARLLQIMFEIEGDPECHEVFGDVVKAIMTSESAMKAASDTPGEAPTPAPGAASSGA